MIISKKTIIDTRFGKLLIVCDSRSRRITLRTDGEMIKITIPPGVPYAEVQNALNKHGEKLLNHQSKLKKPLIDLGYRYESEFFKLIIKGDHGSSFRIRYENENIILFTPSETDFSTDSRQKWLQSVIINAMRNRALETLPPRLGQLASKHGFIYKNCSIRNSQSRWGSCSGKGNINLSLYLITLPSDLIDYVLLHELCHTKEMNHGPEFWSLMDSVTGGSAKQLRNRLKCYKPNI